MNFKILICLILSIAASNVFATEIECESHLNLPAFNELIKLRFDYFSEPTRTMRLMLEKSWNLKLIELAKVLEVTPSSLLEMMTSVKLTQMSKSPSIGNDRLKPKKEKIKITTENLELLAWKFLKDLPNFEKRLQTARIAFEEIISEEKVTHGSSVIQSYLAKKHTEMRTNLPSGNDNMFVRTFALYNTKIDLAAITAILFIKKNEMYVSNINNLKEKILLEKIYNKSEIPNLIWGDHKQDVKLFNFLLTAANEESNQLIDIFILLTYNTDFIRKKEFETLIPSLHLDRFRSRLEYVTSYLDAQYFEFRD